jgi:hypothetical protein
MFFVRKILPLLLGFLLVWGCFPLKISGTPLPEADSGIEGRVWLTATCPEVISPQLNCQDRPYVATIAIFNEQGQLVQQVQSDTKGYFRVVLAPGIYRLQPQSSSPVPCAQEQTVHILPNQMIPIAIEYDSGIR